MRVPLTGRRNRAKSVAWEEIMYHRSAERWARLGTRIGISLEWIGERKSSGSAIRPIGSLAHQRGTPRTFPETLNVVAVYMSQSRSGYAPYGNYGIRID